MTTLNPADKSASITLTGGNLIATGSATTGFANVRATTSKTTGKWYFEVTIGTLTRNIGIGLTNGTFSLSTYQGSDANSCGYFNDAYIGNNDPVNGGSQGTGYSTYAAGDKVQCAFNAATGQVWFGKNGTYQGSPSAGTGGLIAVTFTTFFPTIQVLLGDSVTINFGGSAFTNAPPTGFSAFDGISGAGAATLAITASATGARGNAGTGASTLVLAASATGARGAAGTAAATLAITGSGAGSTVTGAGAATLAITGAASGTVTPPTVTGAGAATLVLTGAGVGSVPIAGSGAATLAITGSGSGATTVVGVGDATLTIRGSGTGTVSAGPTAGRPHDVSIGLGPELFRRQMNDRFPDFGPTLPDIAVTPNGKLFGVGSQLYQAQNGVWVAMS